MKVLVACEFSGIVRDAFARAGHYAMSCDLLDCESTLDAYNASHFKGDIFECLRIMPRWDLGILHPECTRMAVCGNRWHAGTQGREDDIQWTKRLWEAALRCCDRVCLENPQSVIFPVLRKMGALVQYVQPHQFGHPETKKTGLALHNLLPLKGTKDVYEYMMTLPKKERHKIWYMSPGDDRGKDRSRFFTGIGDAMADQWGTVQTEQE